jgi:hypothetical protein
MSAEINWQGGLDALASEFNTCADRLLNDVIDPRMEAETSEALHRMDSRYAFPSLQKGLKRTKLGPGEYKITNSSPHAHLNELGTVARFHADGTPTGTMPARPVIIPESVAARERIGKGVQEDLPKLKSAHLEVTPS